MSNTREVYCVPGNIILDKEKKKNYEYIKSLFRFKDAKTNPGDGNYCAIITGGSRELKPKRTDHVHVSLL